MILGSSPRSSVNGETTTTAGAAIPTVAEAVAPPAANRTSGDYSTYGSGKSGGYRNITVRESIASLRARNALPNFLTADYRPLVADNQGLPGVPSGDVRLNLLLT